MDNSERKLNKRKTTNHGNVYCFSGLINAIMDYVAILYSARKRNWFNALLFCSSGSVLFLGAAPNAAIGAVPKNKKEPVVK